MDWADLFGAPWWDKAETPRQYENVNIDNPHETSEVSSLSHLGVICIFYVCITFDLSIFFSYISQIHQIGLLQTHTSTLAAKNMLIIKQEALTQ